MTHHAPRFTPRLEHLEDRATPAGAWAAGAAAGQAPLLRVFGAGGSVVREFLAFEGSFAGGVRVAVGDVTGDGKPDVVAGSGPGRVAEVRVFDGATGAELGRAAPFGDFTGGVFVAAGDLDGDGKAEVAVTPDEGGGPRVRVFSGPALTPRADFFGIEDANFRGGARVGAGDVDRDGHADLVVAAGFGGGPRVATWDGAAVAAGSPRHLAGDRFVFEPALRNGAFVAVGDVDGDGSGDLIAGAGPGGGPRVLAFSGRQLVAGHDRHLADFFAGPVEERDGVPVGVADLDGDKLADVLTAAGPGPGPWARAFLGKTIAPGATPPDAAAASFAPPAALSWPAPDGATPPDRPTPGESAGAGPPTPAERTVIVGTTDELKAAVAAATPGTHVLLRPGVYAGGLFFGNVRGAAGRAVVIGAADPTNPPVIRGGGEGLQFSSAAYLELRDLVFDGQSGDGLNLDDWGNPATPSNHVTLRNLRVRGTGADGNHDGIKLSGVDQFLVTGCTVEGWGTGGSAVDMVGCHDGVVAASVFRNGGAGSGNGVEAKGGSARVVVRDNRFENAGLRAVEAGGSTGAAFFRPQPPPGYEAQSVTVTGNVIVGSETAVAFVNVDGATVRFNTIVRPGRWPVRVLQENTAAGFVPTRNGVFADNLVVFAAADVAAMVEVGPGTAPRTFTFARNWWYAADDPARGVPALPTTEAGGVYGIDPQLGGDFRPAPGGPAAGVGAFAPGA